MGKIKNIIGEKYGKLTVIEQLDERKNGKVLWLCKCECGGEIKTYKSKLESSSVKSCGCLHINLLFKNGNVPKNKNPIHINGLNIYKTRLYRIFIGMKERCNNQNNKNYNKYGGRGISISKDWLVDFMSFYNWSMSNGYEDILTLDRIDNNGNYEPSNCRWVNRKIQANNRSNNKYVVYEGCKYTYSEFESKFNIPQKNLQKLIKSNSIEDILKMYTYFKYSDMVDILNINKTNLKGIVKDLQLEPDFISNNGWHYFSRDSFDKIKEEVKLLA